MNAGSLSGSQKLIDLTMEIDFPHLGLVEPGRTLIHSGEEDRGRYQNYFYLLIYLPQAIYISAGRQGIGENGH